MGGGALAAVSLSISDVRVEFGQADFPLDVVKRYTDTSSTLSASAQMLPVYGKVSYLCAVTTTLRLGSLS